MEERNNKGQFIKGIIPWNKNKCHIYLVGKRPSPQCIEAARIVTKLRIVTEITRQKMRLAKLGKKLSKEHINKISQGNKGKVRSESARLKYRLSKLGSRNPNYVTGISGQPYTSEFTKRLKEQIRKRDNHECQNCGMTEEEHLYIYSKKLNIPHIDYNKKNCKEDNLITLCKKCNLRANYNRDYWKQYFLTKQGENKNELI